MSLAFLKLAADRTVDDTDDDPAGKLTAMLFEMRRFLGRYGADRLLSAAQAAAFGFDADANNDSPNDSAHILAAFAGPTFTSITPSHAANNTGQAVVVAGENFAVGTVVTINDEPVTSFVRTSSTSLSFHVPADLDPGDYDVKITTPSGLATTAAAAWTSDS